MQVAHPLSQRTKRGGLGSSHRPSLLPNWERHMTSCLTLLCVPCPQRPAGRCLLRPSTTSTLSPLSCSLSELQSQQGDKWLCVRCIQHGSHPLLFCDHGCCPLSPPFHPHPEQKQRVLPHSPRGSLQGTHHILLTEHLLPLRGPVSSLHLTLGGTAPPVCSWLVWCT